MTRCNHLDCVDTGHVTIRFENGEERDYCEYHAQHLTTLETVEVSA